MSAKLNVEELRAQLALRELDASGTKPILVRRLEAALQKEEEEKAARDAQVAASSAAGKKYSRDDADDEAERVNDVDRIQKMEVRELREQASIHGISSLGSKRELVDRLSSHLKEDAEEENKDRLQPEGSLFTALWRLACIIIRYAESAVGEGKLETVTKKSREGEEIYDATLNQTNVGENNNKFYVIQVLGLCFE